jgi:hypothetical protein
LLDHVDNDVMLRMSIRDSGIVSGPAAHRGGVIVDPMCVKELRRVVPRYATIEEATTGIKELRRDASRLKSPACSLQGQPQLTAVLP